MPCAGNCRSTTSRGPTAPKHPWHAFGAALRRAREGRNFRGREAVICLGAPELFVQNVRLAKVPGAEMERLVRQEAAGRLPFPAAEAEIRFLEAADVRQGETTRREVILLACHKPVVDQLLERRGRRGPVAGGDRRRAGRPVAMLRQAIPPRRRSTAASFVCSHRGLGRDRGHRQGRRRPVHQIHRRRRPRKWTNPSRGIWT